MSRGSQEGQQRQRRERDKDRKRIVGQSVPADGHMARDSKALRFQVRSSREEEGTISVFHCTKKKTLAALQPINYRFLLTGL